MSARTREDLKRVIGITAIVTPFGGAFGYFTAGPTLESVLQSSFDTAFIGFVILVYVFFVEQRLLMKFLRSLPFLAAVSISSTGYLVLFLSARAVAHGLSSSSVEEFRGTYLGSNFLAAVGFAFALIFVISFVMRMNVLVGQNVLGAFMLGTYHRPKTETRIFMFADLVGSTRLAESLGEVRFHQFLSDFYEDVTEAVLETRGQIYKYVGDEVIVSWPLGVGARDANCLRCYERVVQAIDRRSTYYVAKYGEAPVFRAGIHGGDVVAGELGVIKQEIAYLGDVLNTAARVMDHCKIEESGLLMTQAVYDALPPEGQGRLEARSSFMPRGKSKEVPIFAPAD